MVKIQQKTILVVVAHPDDEVLGCGGAIAKWAKEGWLVFSLILGEGITSRDNTHNKQNTAQQLKILKSQAQKAGQILGVKETFLENFPDNRFDTVALLNIIKKIEYYKKKLKPHTILTHYENDLNVDHSLTFKAVLTATRPLANESVKQIYAFETLSSTEFRYPLSFSPDTFIDISKTLKIKQRAMAKYKNELRDFPHPRSLKMIERNAQYWGIKTSLHYAEAFKTIRSIL